MTTDGPSVRLGNKFVCFNCGAKFYDLNKPEPICPKCEADQRTRPKKAAAPKPSPPQPSRAKAPMAPLLDEEDDDTAVVEDEEGITAAGPEGFLEDQAAEEEEPAEDP